MRKIFATWFVASILAIVGGIIGIAHFSHTVQAVFLFLGLVLLGIAGLVIWYVIGCALEADQSKAQFRIE